MSISSEEFARHAEAERQLCDEAAPLLATIIRAIEIHTGLTRESDSTRKVCRETHSREKSNIAPPVARHVQKSACSEALPRRRNAMSVSLILLVFLVLLFVGALPSWPYSAGWGYWPSGGLGLVLLVVIVLLVMGRI